MLPRRRDVHAIGLAIAALGSVGGCGGSTDPVESSSEPLAPLLSGSAKDRIADRYIVVFRAPIDPSAASSISADHECSLGVRVARRYGHALRGYAAEMTSEQLTAVRRDPNVELVEADQITYAIATDTSPASWGLDRIDQRQLPLSSSYTYETTASDVEAFIFDTGIRYTHQELAGRAVSGWDFVDGDAVAQDCHGHGTHVAGTVGGASTGVARGVKLIGVRVLDCSGRGSYSGIIAAIDWVTQQKEQRPSVRGSPAPA